jgi:hypothetical protein
VYDMVYELLKLVLLLPVATTGVERVFSAMVLVKTKLRNKMGDSLLNDCLVTFIERDIFFEVDEDDIIKTFMSLQKRQKIVRNIALYVSDTLLCLYFNYRLAFDLFIFYLVRIYRITLSILQLLLNY